MLQTNPKIANALWFSPICNELQGKIALWNAAYWYGEIHSTRKWLNPTSGQVEDKPTRMAHEIPLREIELDHLIRIVESLRPNSEIISELKEIKKIWKYGKPIKGFRFQKSYWSNFILPSGIHRILTMCFYPEHIKEILAILEEAKTGQKALVIETAIEKAKEAGKELFEE